MQRLRPKYRHWRRPPSGFAGPLAAAALAIATTGCGVLFSEVPPEDEVFEGPIEGLETAQLRSFLDGDEAFGEAFDASMGLGPVFNAQACITCHPGDGRGHPSTNLIRFGRGDSRDEAAFDYLPGLGGPQLQDRAIAGYVAETLPPAVAVSERSGPLAVGLGLLEAVPIETLLALADPDDADGDGIRGRLNHVLPPDFVDVPPACDCAGCKPTEAGCKVAGRFGRKATAVDLLHQTAGAYHADMGVTSDFFVDDVYNPLVGGPSGDNVADPEVSRDVVHNVAFYLRTLRPPVRRGAGDPQVLAGEALFGQHGCAACHVPTLQTGDHPIAALAHQTIAPYTDMLLHDLGPRLADGYPEGEATGSDWRTTPLWGLGIIEGQLGGQTFYLHDGRAQTLTEAILLHGGEAQSSTDAFAASSAADQEALLAFLRSL